jgi:hypothetical protein
MKPTNLSDWGPEQVRQFNALGRTKLRECYGELRGLVGEIDGDGDDQIGLEPEEVPLVEGQACPVCGLPLTARWLSKEALYGKSDGIEPDNTSPPKPTSASLAHREALSGARTPLAGRF